ncbi:unnamed protein product [Pleuronectes platessa]|uniref:Uncharacterized protein n=1 Tax=Pleuronectes platessa TaxID=8262 RepID=A0A9N7ZAE2_PLEPL|nr:unnamed protein product [Pleuronectes platessa]
MVQRKGKRDDCWFDELKSRRIKLCPLSKLRIIGHDVRAAGPSSKTVTVDTFGNQQSSLEAGLITPRGSRTVNTLRDKPGAVTEHIGREQKANDFISSFADEEN